MNTTDGALVNVKRHERPVPASPADCLSAAQADAQRMFGEGPVPVWRPPRRSRRWMGVAVAGALLAGALWAWRGNAPVDVAPAAPGAAAAVHAPADAVPVPAPSAAGRRDACDAGECGRPMRPGPLAAAPPAAAPPDSDAWALHPEPVQIAAIPGFTGLANIPEIPDEADATPADETNPEDGQPALPE